jgi:hypothetical protein
MKLFDNIILLIIYNWIFLIEIQYYFIKKGKMNEIVVVEGYTIYLNKLLG